MLKKIAVSIRNRVKAFFKGDTKPNHGSVQEGTGVPKTGQMQDGQAPVKQASGVCGASAVADSGPIVEKKRPEREKRPRKPPWTLEQFVVEEQEGKTRFHDFNIPLPLMHGIADQNFQYCTAIQAKSLSPVLEGKDIIGKANTGTGKTAVFLTGIMARMMADHKATYGKRAPRALILAPTRELVIQIVKDAKKLGRYTHLNVAAVYGGAEYEKQMEILQAGKIDIVVATPGRLIDFYNKRVVRLDRCQHLVIDEADRMLDMGFIPDVRRIVAWTPKKRERQTLMFSATISDEVNRLSEQWCVEPVVVEAEVDQMTNQTIEQNIYLVTAEEKYHILYNLIQQHPEDRIIVFANMKNDTRKLAERLQRNGIDCALLSGDVPQNKRQARLERFRSGKTKVLVATDVAGRGIHVDGINFVVNYTLPYEPEDYVHRIGRTGRAGMAGKSVSFADEESSFYLPDIEEYVGEKLECILPPEELLVPAPKGTAPKESMSKQGDGAKKPYRNNHKGSEQKKHYRPRKGQGRTKGSASSSGAE